MMYSKQNVCAATLPAHMHDPAADPLVPLTSLCSHNLFNQFFLLAIVINTLLLALEFDGMSDTFSSSLETANIVLTVLVGEHSQQLQLFQ